MKQNGKFENSDVNFFKTLNWIQELRLLSFIYQRSPPVYELVKGVLLNHGYKLTYDNIELAKHSLLRFCETNNYRFEKKNFRHFRRDFTAEQLQYMPVSGDDFYVSVYFH